MILPFSLQTTDECMWINIFFQKWFVKIQIALDQLLVNCKYLMLELEENPNLVLV